MNIVERVARTIEPGAYGDWYDGTGPGSKLIEPSTRVMYLRAQAECRAMEILRTILASSPEAIRDDMAAFDVALWRKLGLDHPDLEKIVREKHGLSPWEARP